MKRRWKRWIAAMLAGGMMCMMGGMLPEQISPVVTIEAKAYTVSSVLKVARDFHYDTYDYNGFCLTWVSDVFKQVGITGPPYYSSANLARNAMQTHTDRNIPVGACIFYDAYYSGHAGSGHIEIYTGNGCSIGTGKGKVLDDEIEDWEWEHYTGWGWFYGVELESEPDPPELGHVMTEEEAAGQTIPDGDYWIQSSMDSRYFLDIAGECYAEPGTEVGMALWTDHMPGKYDVWTVTYQNNGFYQIKQKDADAWLHVWSDSVDYSADVFVWNENTWNAQQWSIAPKDGGYMLQCKCSGLALDIADAKVEGGTNVQQFEPHGGACQLWNFIPYDEDQTGHVMSEEEAAGRTIPDGDYWIQSSMDLRYFLDIGGESYAEPGTEVGMALWTDHMPGKYDVWTVTYQNNGFYQIKQKGADAWLHVWADSYMKQADVFMWNENTWNAQQWSIAKKDGGYMLQCKCSGMALDIADGLIEPGTNVQQFTPHGGACQLWNFIPYDEDQTGHVMSEKEAAGRTIPDGDYWIRSSLDKQYYLTIEGDSYAEPGANVAMSYLKNKMPGNYDIWTVTYQGNGFYQVKQKGADEWLHVWADSYMKRANVFVWNENTWNAQQWSIAKTDTGYTMQCKCSSMYLDVADAEIKNGTNVQQFSGGKASCQSWEFISVVYGDVARDSKVTVSDIVLFQRFLHGKEKFNTEQLALADMNGDGVIDIFDLALLKRKLLTK